MSTINSNLSSTDVANMAESITSLGTRDAANRVNSPKGVLQYIVNFFTFGYLRKNNENKYQELVNALANALEENRKKAEGNVEQLNLTDKVSFDIHGCNVTFTKLDLADNKDNIKIEVKSNNEEPQQVMINEDSYKKICDALQLRTRCKIPQSTAILTEEEGLDLYQLDLTQSDLSNVDLTKADMRGVDLSNTTLHNVNLSFANLNFANLEGARSYKVILSGAKLNNTKMKGVYIDETTLDGAGVRNSDMRGCIINNSNLSTANITNSIFTKSIIHNTKMEGVIAGDTIFHGVDFRNIDFSKADFTRASFSKITKNMYSPLGFDISNPADIRCNNFTGSIFNNTQLSGVRVDGANFTDTIFCEVFIDGTDFSQAIGLDNRVIDKNLMPLSSWSILSGLSGKFSATMRSISGLAFRY
ncbi:MAG: pentapeptide repeat-containing protein [Plesiomonas sp.]|uniref:pentapeptide repeat-containing protein n=1 Tax=Plesiomonas sp. TaxID=2486279 RepID=UPI003F2CBB24